MLRCCVVFASYRRVLRACALVADVDILPDKDRTELGDKVVRFSLWTRRWKFVVQVGTVVFSLSSFTKSAVSCLAVLLSKWMTIYWHRDNCSLSTFDSQIFKTLMARWSQINHFTAKFELSEGRSQAPCSTFFVAYFSLGSWAVWELVTVKPASVFNFTLSLNACHCSVQGISLCVGQKIRICIARALYSRADLVILVTIAFCLHNVHWML